jgi:hypothetical protein
MYIQLVEDGERKNGANNTHVPYYISGDAKEFNVALAKGVRHNAGRVEAVVNPPEEPPAHGPCKPEHKSPPWLHLLPPPPPGSQDRG